MAELVRLDHDGIAGLLKSDGFRAAVDAQAAAIAGEVSAAHPDADVVVDTYTTDRAAASVTVRDARAAGWQARDGLLTKAAARVGLEVRSK